MTSVTTAEKDQLRISLNLTQVAVLEAKQQQPLISPTN